MARMSPSRVGAVVLPPATSPVHLTANLESSQESPDGLHSELVTPPACHVSLATATADFGWCLLRSAALLHRTTQKQRAVLRAGPWPSHPGHTPSCSSRVGRTHTHTHTTPWHHSRPDDIRGPTADWGSAPKTSGPHLERSWPSTPTVRCQFTKGHVDRKLPGAALL